MQKITAHLWFNDTAEEAVNFHTYIFKNAQSNNINRYGKGGAAISGRVWESIRKTKQNNL